MTRQLYSRLQENGCRGKVVSIRHVSDVLGEIERRHTDGTVDEGLFQERLAHFDIGLQADSAAWKSVLLVSAPQPQQRLTFHLRGRPRRVIIPPTYSEDSDEQVAGALRDVLGLPGLRFRSVSLPAKLLAVRSGLAVYGKNNISYVEGLGSFHRLPVFVSDLPAVDDDWVEPRSLAECDGCSACAEKCPTDAIGRDRFVLHAEKCLTWYNEGAGEFPDWIKPSWHNCLVGCIRCQLCCPVNGPFLGWFEDAAEFSEEETALMLAGSPTDELPDEMARKLQRLYLLEDLPLVSRNLRVLLSRRRS